MNMHSPFASPRVRRQTGMILPLAVLSMLSLAGLTGAGIDMAFLIWKKRQLQAAVEAGALAGAQDLLTQDANRVRATVSNYVARTAQGAVGGGGQQVSGSSRWYNDLLNSANITVNPPSVELRALPTTQVGLAPGTLSNANALRVTQTAIIRPFFLGLFGLGPFTITGRAAASAGGSTGKPPVNVMLVIDNSGSMNGTNGTPIRDAKAGARALVSSLTKSGNYVGVAVFPPHRNSGVSDQRDCTINLVCTDYQNYMTGSTTAWADSSWSTANPPAPNCTATGTTACAYSTIVPLTPSSDYALNGVLNGASLLSRAIGVGTNGAVNTNCGLEARLCSYSYGSTTYVYHTGLEQAVYQARSALNALSATNEQKNFIVILSDGDFNGQAYDGFAAFQGAISGTTLTVNGTTDFPVGNSNYGKIKVGSVIASTGSGTNVRTGTTIVSVLSGTGEPGTTTTYQVSGASQTVTSRRMRVVSTSSYLNNQCQRAVEAANLAKDDGIEIFAIGYAVAAGGCSTDTTSFSPINDTSITACKTMQWLAGKTRANSYPGAGSPNYYSTTSACTSAVNGVTSNLTSIFADIAEGISNIGSRSIPDDAW